jgi:hypothetical protein
MLLLGEYSGAKSGICIVLTGAPHLLQNDASGASSFPHFEQNMVSFFEEIVLL